MNLTNFKSWARKQLGEGDCFVKVELSEGQLEQALENAKEWFNAYIGLYREETVSMVEGQAEYDLSAVSPGIDNIVNVWFPRSDYSIDYSVLYPGFLDIDGFPYVDSIAYGIGYPQTTLVQQMQTLESLGRVLTVDLAWEYYEDRTQDPDVKLLRVMPEPRTSGVMIYQYRIDPADIKLEYYKSRDLIMLRSYALAEAKYMLGRMRGKYTNGLPAAGGDRQLDGEALLQEARDDKERLEAKILDYEGPISPVIG